MSLLLIIVHLPLCPAFADASRVPVLGTSEQGILGNVVLPALARIVSS